MSLSRGPADQRGGSTGEEPSSIAAMFGASDPHRTALTTSARAEKRLKGREGSSSQGAEEEEEEQFPGADE
jgi:hypothetical protein